MADHHASPASRTPSLKDRWLRLRDTRLVAPWLGTSWRKLHSPTLFTWGRALQSNPNHWPDSTRVAQDAIDAVAAWRTQLSRTSDLVIRRDLGAGERKSGKKQATVSVQDMASRALTPEEDARALCRWLRCVAPKGRFLELGTSLGVMSAHVAATGWEVDTWEGCPQTLEWAQKGWDTLGCSSGIHAQCGNFLELAGRMGKEEFWDVVYLDGFHEEGATLHLVDALAPHVREVLVIDDIAWSHGMHRAWRELQSRPEWRVSFSWRGRGFLLKAPNMRRQHVRLA